MKKNYDRNKSILGGLHSSFMDAGLSFEAAKPRTNPKREQTTQQVISALNEAEERRLKRQLKKAKL